MKRICLYLLYFILCGFFSLFAQELWKPYFTLQPEEGRAFTIDSTAVLYPASVPGANVSSDGQLILGYAAGSGGRGQATTENNGRSFTPMTDYLRPMAGDGAFVYLPDGRTRFITEEPLPSSTRQRHKSQLVSWISYDGINWARETGVRYQPGAEDDFIASVPAAIQVADSIWRLYYVGDWYHSNGTRSAISYDWGWTWQPESKKNILRNHDVDPHPLYLTNGQIRIYHRHMREPGGIAFTDGDGLIFDTAQTQLILPDGINDTDLLLDPAVVKFPDGNIACYIGNLPSGGHSGGNKIIAAWATVVAVSVKESGTKPTAFLVHQNYPNPFNASTTISYQLARPGKVEIVIYNGLGEKIQTLVNEKKQSGTYAITWDGTDDAGSTVSSGIYYYQLITDNYRSYINKMVFLK